MAAAQDEAALGGELVALGGAEGGRGAGFVLAASRLAFCGGFDLEDPEILAEAAAAAECAAKLKSIAVETAAAEAAVAKLRAELAAWQRVLDRHGMALPGLDGVRAAAMAQARC